MIVDFYLNNGENNEGLTFDQMLAATDEQLEHSHTWVQWLFPLNEGSAHNRHAPVLGAEEIAALATKEGQAQYIRAFDRFMAFYGMQAKRLDTDKPYVSDVDDEDEFNFTFDVRAKNWLKRDNHNLKRITRIIRCAMLLNLPVLAQTTNAAFAALRDHPYGLYNLEDRVLQFWSDAVNLPLDVPINPLPSNRVFRV